MRRNVIIGNWKMNKTVQETIRMITELKGLLSGKQELDVVIAPPYTSLHPADIASNDTPIQLGAQDGFYEESGAYTGAISFPMLADVGVNYVILGHSERRQIFGEGNDVVNKKVRACVETELIAVLCVGETKAERDANKTFDVIEEQLREGLRGINDSDAENLIIAYEPIWAIGTGEAATASMAQEVHQMIREKLANLFRKDLAYQMRILYGGSVKPDNAKSFLEQEDVDGLLVGGASLDAASFYEIIQAGD